MATATKVSKSDLLKQIQALEAVPICVETNQGTYGSAECHRAIGVGDPRYGDYFIYETVGGRRHREGCEKGRAPGYARYLNADEMSSNRKELAALRKAYNAI